VCLHREIQEEKSRSILWKLIVSVIVKKKKVHVNIYLILNSYRVTAVAIWRAIFATFLFTGLGKEQN